LADWVGNYGIIHTLREVPMEQLFTGQFWHDQWIVIMSAPWLIIPLLLVAFVIGTWLQRYIDGREIRGLNAENKALEKQFNLATQDQSTVTKEIAKFGSELEQLKTEIAQLRDAHPQIETLSNAIASIGKRLDVVSQANSALGQTLHLSARGGGYSGSRTSLTVKPG
jgi:septal ring factor EnvC (AmiA/AmiB activator)